MTGADKRTSKRQRMLLKARIRFNNNNSIIDCTLRDLSETGAQIFFEHPIPIPREFILEIPSKKLTYPCEVRWTRFQVHGVMFTNQPSAALDPAKTPEGGRSGVAASEGWLVSVTAPGEPSHVRVFAVAESQPSEALAIVVKHTAASHGERFAVEGPVSARVIRLLGAEPGTVLDLSP